MAAAIIPAVAGLAGSFMDAGAKSDANAAGVQMTREQMAEAARQFNLLFDQSNDKYNKLSALAGEDLATRRGDADMLRKRVEQYLSQMLGETSSSDVFKKGGQFDATGGAGSDSIMGELLKRMTVDAPNQRADAATARNELPKYEAQLAERGPSADEIAGLINKAGQAENADEFGKARNMGAMALARTGAGNGATSRLYSELAARQAGSRAQIATQAQLQGLSGAESLASSKAARLQPIIASLVARSTKSPDAGLPDDTASQRNTALSAALLNARTGIANSLVPAGNITAGGLSFPQAGVTASSVQSNANVKNNTQDPASYGSTVASLGDFIGDIFKKKAPSGG